MIKFLFECFVLILFIKLGLILANEDFSHGIKPVIEKVWCGNSGCLGR